MNALCPNIMVSNMTASIDFYTNILGFEVAMSVPEDEPFAWAMLTNGDATLMLQSQESLSEELPALANKLPGGTFTLYIDLNDLESIYAQIKDRVTIVRDLQTADYGRKELVIADPDGYLLALSEHVEAEA